jgi:hypothetical protein
MAQIVEVLGVGEVEFPDGMSQEQMAVALNKLPKPKFQPTAQNRGNVINTDVPTLVGERPNAVNAQPTARPVNMMDRVKALYEVPTAVAASMVTEPLSQAYGVVRSIPEAIRTGQAPAELGQKYAQQARENISYRPSSPVSQAALETVGSAFEAAKLPPYIGNIGAIPSFIQQAPNVRPVMQESVIPAGRNMANALRNEGQMIQEAVQPTVQRMADVARPIAEKAVEIAQPVTNKMAEALRREPTIDIAGIARTAPAAQDLEIMSTALFEQAKNSGVVFKPQQFVQKMTDVGAELRSEGYTPTAYPKITGVLSELQDVTRPKDFVELQALRKIIGGVQASTDPTERRLASILKSNFDEYIANAPENAISAGTKQGVQAWKDARDTYSKLMKSEIFTDMLEKAELDKTKFSMSGTENALTAQLRQLAKNDKKMRLFTPLEQKAIKQALKGSTSQNVMRLFGKFAPTSAVSSIPALLTTSVSGPVGLALTAGSIGARYGATKMRKSEVENLSALMRAGAK